MRGLVQSGEFARLARLSRKALRLYAELGLLRPVHVNGDTGYRYYSVAQLEDASRIACLRDIGMSLDAIREALPVWTSPELADHLERHRARLHLQSAQIQSALQTVDMMLRTPRRPYNVAIKPVRALTYLGIRDWCRPDDACEVIGAIQHRVQATMDDLLVRPAGPLMVRYHDETDDAWDIEVCVPIRDRPAEALPADITLSELPPGEAAFTIHEGDCGGNYGMQAAYGAVWQWVHEHGYRTLGGPCETYLFDASNTTDPNGYRTELAWMVQLAPG